jgi:iron uptake system EfeUOB component EfeO/EfeM
LTIDDFYVNKIDEIKAEYKAQNKFIEYDRVATSQSRMVSLSSSAMKKT